MGEEVKWVRKAAGIEVAMDKVGHSGNLLVVYRLSLCARRPVEPQQVEQALTLLYRKSPNLRVYLAERGGEGWFREMAKEKIDFEVSAEDVDEVTDFLHTQGYPTDGPLWRARLVPEPTPRYHPQRFSSFHDDLQDTFPHCYHLLFGFSHAIGDGHTFIRICAAFARIFDRVLSGEEVDEEQIGSFDLNEEYDSKSKEYVTRVFTDRAWRDECIGKANEGKPELPLLPHVLSPCEHRPKKTILYTQTLDKTTTTRILEKCRAAKVTLSSCVAAAGNLAFVDMLVEKGVVQDNYTISNSHLINMRRTWPKGTTEHAFGCYISTSIRQFLETPRAAEGDQFWQYAKDIHGRFYSILHNDQFMEIAAFVLWCYISENFQYLDRDQTYNTRGDLTQKFEGIKEVTVTNLLSSTSIHNSPIPWDHVFGTVRGRLSHTIKYNTGLVSEATAVKYSDLVYGRLVKVAAQ